MKLKLDLHPIYSRGQQIESALQSVIDEACDARVSEIEIIPGKGSGALKKTVLRFLDRPEVKSRYHRIEKDSENWGRIFVHFRWDKAAAARPSVAHEDPEPVYAACFACDAPMTVPAEHICVDNGAATSAKIDCASCGSPNRVEITRGGRGSLSAASRSGYD